MMNTRNNGANAYRSVGVETQAQSHDQYQLVVLMYDAVLESLARSRGAIAQGDTPTKLVQLDKAIRILQEGLRTSLDLENGGDLATNLAALYDYAILRITQANATNNVEMLSEVSNLIHPLADAWKQMRSPQNAPTQASASAQDSLSVSTPVDQRPTAAPRSSLASQTGMRRTSGYGSTFSASTQSISALAHA